MLLRAIRALLASLAPSLAPSLALAASIVLLLPSKPNWVTPGTVAELQFATGQSYNASLGNLTFSRSGSQWVGWADGHWSTVASGVMGVTSAGLWVWNASTNLAFCSRDLTNVSCLPGSQNWTVTGAATAALTATGIDNVANDASTITTGATSSGFTQSVPTTVASVASAFIKCGATCVGPLQMSLGNGAVAWTSLTTTQCTDPISGTPTAPTASKWVRCYLSLSAVTSSAVIGVRSTSSGDIFLVDQVKLESIAAANQPTAPVTTTTAAASNSANSVQVGANSQLSNCLLGGQGFIAMGFGPLYQQNSSSRRALYYLGNAQLELSANSVVWTDNTTNITAALPSLQFYNQTTQAAASWTGTLGNAVAAGASTVGSLVSGSHITNQHRLDLHGEQ